MRGRWSVRSLLSCLVIGGTVLVVGCADDAAAGWVDRARGRWRCAQPDPDERPRPFEVEVGDGTFTWFGSDGDVVVTSTWELDGSRLELDMLNPVGDRWAFTGVAEDTDRIATHIRPDDDRQVDVEVLSDDAVTFREVSPGAVTWTCRRR